MSSQSLTLVCFAVKEEAKFFKPLARAQSDVQILLTGMGSANAEKTLQSFLTKKLPRLVVSAGFAGGLKPGLSTGTVLFEIQGDKPAFRTALAAAGAVPATFHFAQRVATLSSEKRRLRESTGADAVEMESYVISRICADRQVPSVTVRVVLDTLEEDLPLDFNQLLTPDHRLDGRKLAIALLRSPGKIRSLLRLQKQSDLCAQRLAQVLAQVFLKNLQAARAPVL